MIDPTRGNVSTITVTNYNDGDVFTCRADNDVGFDEESTTINVFGKWIANNYCILNKWCWQDALIYCFWIAASSVCINLVILSTHSNGIHSKILQGENSHGC